MVKKLDQREKNDIKEQIKTIEVGLKNNIFTYKNKLAIDMFAKLINKSTKNVINQLIKLNNNITYSSSYLLSEDQIAELCLEYGFDFKKEKEINERNIFENIKINDAEKDLKPRAPIVTIMGHVDHGKTTLLDYIKKSNLAKKEVGGITQSIGAYQIKYNNSPITFIDTPGHKAFGAMREMGANITDIVVLVVAADDGIKAQTKEAISQARSAGVPIIVFVNKMDKPGVNPEVIMNQLTDLSLTPEEWGGETILIKGSALTGLNVNQLIEAILLQAEMHEYKSNPNRLSIGTIIESGFEKGLGASNNIIVQTGTLKIGDYIIAGESYGKIKSIIDENGKQLKMVEPSKPAKIFGLNTPANAGQKFITVENEKQMKEFEERVNRLKSGEEMKIKIPNNPNQKNFNIILKSNTSGSLEAIKNMLGQTVIEGMNLNIVKNSIGGINDNDISIAKASNSIIIGFNVKPTKQISETADINRVKILFYDIIYKLYEDIEKMLIGELEPLVREEETGEALIQQIWQHSKIGTIAGCKCINGEINRNDSARVLRNGIVLYTTKIGSMKHFKDEVSKVKKDMEFGITLEKINDLIVGDMIQCYKIIKEKRSKA